MESFEKLDNQQGQISSPTLIVNGVKQWQLIESDNFNLLTENKLKTI